MTHMQMQRVVVERSASPVTLHRIVDFAIGKLLENSFSQLHEWNYETESRFLLCFSDRRILSCLISFPPRGFDGVFGAFFSSSGIVFPGIAERKDRPHESGTGAGTTIHSDSLGYIVTHIPALSTCVPLTS
jgi:hypothetical protein